MLINNKKLIDLKIDSVKYHPLYVVKNTLLTRDFKNGFFTPIDEDTYVNTVVESIKELPDSISIQRVTAGIDDKTLLNAIEYLLSVEIITIRWHAPIMQLLGQKFQLPIRREKIKK